MLGNYAIAAAPIAGRSVTLAFPVALLASQSFGTITFTYTAVHPAPLYAVPSFGPIKLNQFHHVQGFYTTRFGRITFSRHHTLPELLHMISPNVSLQETPRVFNLAYGDGYYSDMPDGIQQMTRTLTLVWDGIPETEIQMLMDYFRATSGTAISFVPPREQTPRKWITQQLRRTKPYPTAGALTATFIEKVP